MRKFAESGHPDRAAFGLLCPLNLNYALILTNTESGYIFGDFFKNSSGHPDRAARWLETFYRLDAEIRKVSFYMALLKRAISEMEITAFMRSSH
jgi:hypothetical protein